MSTSDGDNFPRSFELEDGRICVTEDGDEVQIISDTAIRLIECL